MDVRAFTQTKGLAQSHAYRSHEGYHLLFRSEGAPLGPHLLAPALRFAAGTLMSPHPTAPKTTRAQLMAGAVKRGHEGGRHQEKRHQPIVLIQ